MNFDLTSGRKIAMSEFRQSRTYAGLLAGMPTRDLNKRQIAGYLDLAKTLGMAGEPPVLIAPVPRVTGRTERVTGVPEERLPDVVSLALFQSGPLEKPDAEPYSALVVVWFQPAFGLPDDPAILDQLRGVDWESRAWEWCW